MVAFCYVSEDLVALNRLLPAWLLAAPGPGFSASFPVPNHTDQYVIGAQQMLTEYTNNCAS